ncbi:MAG: EndoU domain-containing protein [Granulosicoccus sp.]|nr:EndoU domain-containing protein [Granulosicoccus sp.]
MKKYKRYIPIVALVLVALGVNLDKFGIDLQAISKGDNSSVSSTSNQHSSSSNNNDNRSAESSSEHPSYDKWSSTDPNINLWHIFEGEINRSGKPVGFHSRPDGQDPANARLVAVRDKPNRSGVYTATIEVRDGGQWKSKFSSFFPDTLSREQVIDAILNAYRNSNDKSAQPFEGPSGLGFTVQGYTSNRGGINTAFPVFSASQ